jgi:DNA-binding PadR family transcriptional regulator
MQVSYSTAVVLQLVANGFRHGFDIMEASGLPSGTVYPALRRLERSGLVRSKWEPEAVARKAGRPRRRYYELSRHGLDALGGARKRFPLLQHVPNTGLGQPDPEGA